MKIVAIGDIHGRKCWHDIISKENPDKVIFLGDYVSTHDRISAEDQLENLKNILDFKEENPDKVILLRGNHDTQHLGYYWAACSGFDRKVHHGMQELNKRFLADTKWCHLEDIKGKKFIFSHAGISKIWLSKNVNPYIKNVMHKEPALIDDIDGIVEEINSIEPCEIFGFTSDAPWDFHGTSDTQSIVWIRPDTLINCMLDDCVMVVGHTPVATPALIDERIWLCDALNERIFEKYSKYLIINEGEESVGCLSSKDETC